MNINKNEIPELVMKLDDDLYRIACGCKDPDHDLTVEFDYDKEFRLVYINFYKKIALTRYRDYYSDDNEVIKWLRYWKERIKLSFKILFTGYSEYEESFSLGSKEHIEGFKKCLEEGLKYVEARNG